MRRSLASRMLCAVALLLAVSPAVAEVYTVTLKNGGIIQSRRPPKAAGYAEGVLIVLTEVGNRAAVAIDDIASITSSTEAHGFGTVLDSTTFVLGWAPNDAVEEEELDVQERMLQLMEQRNQPRPDYSVEQFAEPSQSTGIPMWMTGVTTPPLGGAGGPPPMSGVQPNSIN